MSYLVVGGTASTHRIGKMQEMVIRFLWKNGEQDTLALCREMERTHVELWQTLNRLRKRDILHSRIEYRGKIRQKHCVWSLASKGRELAHKFELEDAARSCA